jgi:hypothetical protein
MMQVLLLNAKQCSGRGVKFKTLTPAERDRVSVVAAQCIGKDATNLEYSVKQTQELVQRCIVAVTAKDGYTDMDQMLDEGTEWTNVQQADLCNQLGPLFFAKLFTAKDDDILSRIITSLHVASKDEVDAIVGKALTVSEG